MTDQEQLPRGVVTLADRTGAAGHEVGDGFEMSASECASFIDDLIRGEQRDPETRIYDDTMLRKFREVSYHLHWHCANLDGK